MSPGPSANPITVLALVGLLLLGSACRNPSPLQANGHVIRYVGSPEYEDALKGFRVDYAEARRLLTAYLMRRQPEPERPAAVFLGDHRILVDEAYHFYVPEKTPRIPLTGYYVDGHTGRVEFRKVKGTVPYRHQIK